ncbi:MAG: Anthranilate synthase component 1 [Planctomycetota bacterium]|jgi:anthranilate synthase component 1
MASAPTLLQFEQLAKEYNLIPVHRRLLADSLTPVSAFHRLDDGHSSGCLFESVIGGEKVGRYSFIATRPEKRIAAWGNRLIVQEGGDQNEKTVDDPLDFFRQQLRSFRVPSHPDLPPFIGGAVGYAAYDVVRYVEKLDSPPPDDRHLPDLDFSFFHELVVFDNVTKTLIVVVLVQPDKYASPAAAYTYAEKRIDHIVESLNCNDKVLRPAEVNLNALSPLEVRSNFTQSQFEEAVRTCTEYIRAGDIFQVVVSQRMEVETKSDPLEIYRSLRVINPSPFMFFLRTPDTTLVGASPEVMCRVLDGRVTVRPLAGTRRRGQTEDEDRQLAQELLADPKERAEHVMLVDLGRNDVGRVAQFGSVRLSDIMTIERYSHVMHISSNVDGQLRPELDAIDALKACLPAGTVSGAPKVRAMQILDEIEPTRRGPYAGAVGYFDYGGNMDTCIALRTMVVTPGKVYIQAGAGIVADSDPTSEYQETLNKSKAMLKAVELTEARLK